MDKKNKKTIELLLGAMFLILLLMLIVSLIYFDEDSSFYKKKISYHETFVEGKVGNIYFGSESTSYSMSDGKNELSRTSKKSYACSKRDYILTEENFIYFSEENSGTLKVAIR